MEDFRKRLEAESGGIVKDYWETTATEKRDAKQIITIKDLAGITYSSGAVSLQEMSSTLSTLSNSYVAESSAEIAGLIDTTKTAISTFQGYNNVISTYRKVKPIMKTAVNIGGLVFNFANAGEMAQDVLQYILVKAKAEVMKNIDAGWTSFMNTPILVVLGDSAENVVDTYNEIYNACKDVLNEYLLELSTNLGEFLELVRRMNDYIIKQEGEFDVKNFIEFSNIFVYDVKYNNGYTYFATKKDGIVRIKNSKEEIFMAGVEARNLFFDSQNNLYYTTLEGNTSKLFINIYPNVPIVSTSGVPIGITEFDGKIILLTNTGIFDTSGTIASTTSLKCFALYAKKLYFSDGIKVLFITDISSVPTEGLVLESPIETMVKFKDDLVLGLLNGGKVEICSYETQPKFIKPTCNEFGFTFIKKIGSTIYATKGRSMYTITETETEIVAELLLNNLPEEVSGLEIVPIDGSNYFVVASKEMLVVSKNTIGEAKWWDEKVIDIEAVGLKSGLITDIYYDGTDIYIAILKSVVKISNSNFNQLKPERTIISPSILPNEIIEQRLGPDSNVIKETIDFVSVTKIKEFDDYVYKIHSVSSGELVVSAGNKIIYTTLSTGVQTAETFRDKLYLSQITDKGVFYTNGIKLYLNDILIKTVNGKDTLLSMYLHKTTGGADFDRIIVFSKDDCFVETIDAGFTIPMSIKISLTGNKLFMNTDNVSLLVSDGRSVVQASNLEDGIYEYIQSIQSIEGVYTGENTSYIQASDNILYENKRDVLYKSLIYHNGYKHKSFYSKGVGVAPYDYSSNVFLNTRTPKKEYIDFMKESFVENFIELMKKIPEVIIEEVISRVQNANIDIETSDAVVLLRNRVQTEISNLLSSALSLNFAKDTSTEQAFVDRLVERMNLPGRFNLTEEFYNIAFEIVSEIIKNIIEQINQLGSYALWYYNEHKKEWSDKIISEIYGNYVSESKYAYLLNPCRETEFGCINDLDIKLNRNYLGQINVIKEGKTGFISNEDKSSLNGLIATQNATLIESMDSYETWANSIKEVILSVYKIQQQNQYEDIVNASNMEPIQWNELPEMIDRERFLEELEVILQGRREQIIAAINLLVGLGQVNCYSCIDENTAVSSVKKKINRELNMMRSSAHNKVINSGTYENLPNSFYIYEDFGAEMLLPPILNSQSDLYAEYLSEVVNIVINEVSYLIPEEDAE